jgi:hypothetical protein
MRILGKSQNRSITRYGMNFSGGVMRPSEFENPDASGELKEKLDPKLPEKKQKKKNSAPEVPGPARKRKG